MGSRRDFLEKLTVSAVSLPILYGPTRLFAACEQPYNPDIKSRHYGPRGYGTHVARAMVDCKRAKLVGVISGTPYFNGFSGFLLAGHK